MLNITEKERVIAGKHNCVTDKQVKAFFHLIRPIPIDRRNVKMPKRYTRAEYIEEYNLILNKSSDLNNVQRKVVQNYVHSLIRTGQVVVTLNNQ